MGTAFTFTATSIDDTIRVGQVLGEVLPPGSTVALCGTLGAGKTRLTQALAESLGAEAGSVVSPTFVLCQHYDVQRTLHHFDAYRLKDDDEFLELGPEECFDSDGITLVEWADRVRDCMPQAYLEVRIEITGENTREMHFTAHGDSFENVVQALAAKLSPA